MKIRPSSLYLTHIRQRSQLWSSRTQKLCLCCMQVARKLVILEGDLERSEERAEVAEA